MSILKRIKNLWEISSFVEKEKEELKSKVLDEPKEKKMAKIISLDPDPIEQFDEIQTT